MSAPNRRAEFFALEASEYLSELEPLAARAETPDLERLVRGARALRGAALMAGLGTFARAAAGLEAVARQVRDQSMGWQPYARPAWREGLLTLRGLVSRATAWEAADDRQALGLADRLEAIASGQGSAENPAPAPTPVMVQHVSSSLTPGVRAFIARESELIAGSLLEASRALAPLPPTDALAAVLERMRSLRGLGAAGELSPLPELLEAMESTTRSLLSDPAPPPGVASVFADASDALTSMAHSVARDGRVQVPEGLDDVARRLLETFTAEHDVVPIATLGYDGEGLMLERGVLPQALPAAPVPIELVSVGDHLMHQAHELEHPGSAAARDLRLFVLHRTLTSMPTRSGTGHFVAPLAQALSRAIGSGTGATSGDAFNAALRDAGQFLVECGDQADIDALTLRRDALVRMIDGGATASSIEIDDIVPIASLAPVDTADDIVAIESLAPDEDEADVVSIASLAPDDEAWDVVPIGALAPDADDELDVIPIAALAPDDAPGSVAGVLERGFRRRSELLRSHGEGPADLEALVGDPVIAVDDLLYRGSSAMARAEEIRGQLSGILAEPTVELGRLRPLLDELLDLVALARDAA